MSNEIEMLLRVLDLVAASANANKDTAWASLESDNSPLAFWEDKTGQFVLVRSNMAGVHAGTLHSLDRHCVTLLNSRRLWSWKAAQGISLSDIAQWGIESDESRLGYNADLTINSWNEVIICSPAARDSILSAPSYMTEQENE